MVKVSFHHNAKALIDKIRLKGQAPDSEHLAAAVSFWQNCRPVHRLPVSSFAKVLRTGFLGSQHCLQTHAHDSEFAMQLPSVVALVASSFGEYIAAIQDFVDAFVRHEVLAHQASRHPILQPQQGQEVALNAMGGQKAQIQNAKQDLNTRREHLMTLFRRNKVQSLETELSGYTRAFQELQAASEEAARQGKHTTIGIGHQYDRVLETNKMVFAILGPHTLNYGEDKDGDEHDQGVHLIFRPECLHHPDVFVTPMAATFYNSGHGDAERPWWKCWQGSAPTSAFDKMTAEKLHPSSPLFYEALAHEFLAREAHKKSKPLREITREDMLRYLKTANAHHVVETHLPYATPLTWVERVIISEHTFAKMSESDQITTRTVFGPNLEIVAGTDSAQAQWKYASSKRLQPVPRPSFSWTVLPTRILEVVLPVQIPPKQRTRIFFRASRPNFRVNLASDRRSRGLLNPTFVRVDGEQCTVHDPSRKFTSVDKHFNRGVGKDGSAMYCLDVDGHLGRISFQHAGVSSMFSSSVLSFDRVGCWPKHVSFVVPRGHISFSDVRVYVGSKDTYLLEHECAWQPLEQENASAAGTSAATQDDVPGQVKIAFRSEPEEGWMSKAYHFVTGKGKSSAPALKLCSSGLECQVLASTHGVYGVDDLPHHLSQHMRKNRHLCLHGRSCRHLGDGDHDLLFVHMEKQDCPNGDACGQLCDPHHRAEYHHDGLWDLLLPCRHGSRCNIKDEKHGLRYHHDATLKYILNDDGLQLAKASCRSSLRGCAKTSEFRLLGHGLEKPSLTGKCTDSNSGLRVLQLAAGRLPR